MCHSGVLMNGPFPILANKGMCNWRFILTYLSVLFSLITKTLFFACVIIEIINGSGSEIYSKAYVVTGLIILSFLFLPNMIFAVINIALSTGCSKKLTKTIFGYPAILILTAITFYTIGPNTFPCCKQSQDNTSLRNELVVSKTFTVINMALTTFMYTICIVALAEFLNDYTLFYVFNLFVPLFFESLLLTTVILVLDCKFCFSRSQQCLFPCCCGPSCYELREDYTYQEAGDIDFEEIELKQ